MKTNFPRIAVVLLTMLFVAACSKTEEHFIHPSSENIDQMAKAGAKDNHAFVAHSWMALQLQLIKADGNFTPPVASRSLGFAGFTLYETVVGKMPQHRSIAAQVGAPPMPAMPNHSIDEAIAANKSMHDLLISFFVYPGNPLNALVQQKCDALYAGNFAVLTEKVPPSKITLSETHGAAIAAAVYAWSATDPAGHRGQMRNTDPHYTMTPWPGVWQPTPAAYGMPVQPHWGNARTFVKANAEGACIAVMPIPFSTHPSSEFYSQAMEVYEVSRNLTEEQQTIARYWADGAGTITPPGHMMSITMQVLQQEEASLGMAAETYCKVGMALSDAFVACWKGKYTTTLMRPVTYIRQHIQPGWLPILATPPFPSFASGHATQSGAAAAVLTSLYGSHYTFTDHTHDGLGFQPRNFTSFDQAADEAAISRLYGGIHYSMDNDEGLAAGNIIGRNICSIRFKK
jgi:hypothetical protein